MSIFKMAWRNIWRNRRRSIVTVAAMSFALLVMILYSGLVAGMLEGFERNVVELEVGDVQIFAPGFRDKPQLHTRLADGARLVRELEGAGFRAAPRLLASGLAAAKDESAGVALRGVDVARDRGVSAVYNKLATGSWLDPKRPKEVVLGRRLARNLEVKPGSELVLLTQGGDGSLANDLYKVRGVLRGVSEAVDRSCVFMTAGAFRELLVLPSGTHQIIVRRPQRMSLAAAAAEVRRLAPQQDAKSWRELMPTIASWLESARGMIYAMFMIVFLAIGIVILNAMLMAVFERVREFGVLKAVGMSPATVLRLVMTETALMAGLSILVGGALSVPGVWYLASTGIDLGAMGGMSVQGISWDAVWRASVSAETFVGPVIILLVLVLPAALYPAVKAALISPVAAIQHR